MCPACQECKADTGVCGALNDSQTDPRCTDTDGTNCTKPGCEAGVCVQAHIPPPSCPACQECKAATGRCGAICTRNQCCNPNTGQCVPVGTRGCRTPR